MFKLARAKTFIKSNDNIIFFRQLCTLISAGIPIIESLTLLASHQVTSQQILHQLRENLLNGSSLYQAMLSCKFETWICELIQLGEHTGKLSEILVSIANHLEKQWQLKKRLVSIIFYPCLILLLALFIACFLLMVVVPQFQMMFKETNIELPLITRCIFYSADLLNIIGLPTALLLPSAVCLLKMQNGRILLFIKKLPILKHYFRKNQLATWSQQLSLALAAGLPITKALELVDPSDSATHAIYVKIRERLMSGEALYRALMHSQYFPPFMVQMIKIGEHSGQLESMLHKIGEIYSKEVEQSLSLFCQILDPLIMVGLGVLIGGLLIGIYLPIFNLGTTL